NFDLTGLSDLDEFSINLSQGASNSQMSFKVYQGNNPDIVFGGWDDVVATGKKTYKFVHDDEEGEVWFAWKEWPEDNTCRPQGIKILRSSDNVTFTEVPLSDGEDTIDAFDHETFDFLDNTLSETDFGRAWYYKLKVIIAGQEYDVDEPNELASIRIIAPPDNMALVHRWIANQSICSDSQIDPDPVNHYSCTYDLGHDLIVDRFENGCNVSSTCGVSGNELCVGSSEDLDSIGLPAAVGSVFYDNISEDGAGGCWYKHGVNDSDWYLALNPS